MRTLVALALIGFMSISCGGSADQTAQVQALQPAAQSQSASTAMAEMPIDVSDPDALDVKLQVDEKRAARRLMSTQGGAITATGADGSVFTLTIPPNALLGDEEIILTPVTEMTGAPEGASIAAGVQMSPDGLLLLRPATLTIEPKQPVPPDREIAVAWSRQGEGMHAPLVAPTPGVATLHITHFSGAAIASATASAVDAILKAPPARCAGQFFSGIAAMARRARGQALMGTGSGDMSAITTKFIEASRQYLKAVLAPIAKQAEKEDSLLPCAASAVLTWERQAQLLLGDTFEPTFGADAKAVRDSIWKGLANLFTKSSERCQRAESPLFQLARMGSAARMLVLMSEAALLPADHAQKILSCARAFDYQVNVESEVSNTYNEQGQGIGVASSKTRVEARGMVAKYDAKSSAPELPVFIAKTVPAEASVSIEPRNPCPDKARIAPGATIDVTVKPIINVRVGQLRCRAGKAQCDTADTNPGVLVVVAPQVVENTFEHTYTSGKCTPDVGWNEFMMFFMGRTSTGGDQPFQIRGEQGGSTVVRHGGPVRRMPIDIPPQILKMNPGMKNYVDIQTPAIKEAIERTSVSIQVQRR